MLNDMGKGFAMLGSRILGLVLLGLIAAGVAGPARADKAADRLLIIAATRTEFEAVVRRVGEIVVNPFGPSVAAEGRLGTQDVVVLLSGVSTINAAMTTQWALDTYSVRAILVSGTAAGLEGEAIRVGDVVIAGQWGHYTEMFFLRETGEEPPETGPLGYPLLVEPFLFMAPRPARPLPSKDEPIREKTAPERFWYPADGAMVAAARDLAPGIALTQCLPDDTCLEAAPQVRFVKAGVSGSVFMDNVAFGAYLRATFGASILDMESAAIAIVAAAGGVPFLAVRAVSDVVRDTPPGDHQYVNYHPLAAENAARATVALASAFQDQDGP